METLRGIADDRIVERGQAADLLVIGRDGQDAAEPDRADRFDGRRRCSARREVDAGRAGRRASSAGPIVLGFDGSPGSRIAAKLAVELANGLERSRSTSSSTRRTRGAPSRASTRSGSWSAALSVPVRETSSTLGRPDVKIVDTAREVRAGLIVMGAYGRNRITDYFLGSNAAAVARTSPVAVLLAR